MNRTEATSVLTYLNRAGLVGAMEGAGAVWADALHDVPYATAQEVVREMVRTRTSRDRWVTPGDVAERVRQIRSQRLVDAERHNAHHLPPPPDLTPVRELAWRRAYREGLAGGLDSTAADTLACAEIGAVRPPDGDPVPDGHLRALLAGATTSLTQHPERTHPMTYPDTATDDPVAHAYCQHPRFCYDEVDPDEGRDS